MGTIYSKRVDVLNGLKNMRSFNRRWQGKVDWKMHEFQGVLSVLWKDKKLVLVLSTHGASIRKIPCIPFPTVPRRNGAMQDKIWTSPMHLEYTTHLKDVDVAD